MQDKDNDQSKKDIEYLIKSLKFMLKENPELKIEEKIMHLCGVPTHSLQKPISISQAIILRAIAPVVAPVVFSKKFYNTLYTALFDELTNDPVDIANNDPARI